jgi:hypothetical protein
MENINKLENIAKGYLELKRHDRSNIDLAKMAYSIVEALCSSSFTFPVQKEGIVSEGTTSFIYADNFAYPSLFEFLSGILHLEVPIKINKTKFGPGEILINIGNEEHARQEVASSIEELKKLIRAKNTH